MPDAVLERERRKFEEILDALLREHTNEWAVLHGDDLLGVRPSLDDAFSLGYSAVAEDEPFLVTQIIAPEASQVTVMPTLYLRANGE